MKRLGALFLFACGGTDPALPDGAMPADAGTADTSMMMPPSDSGVDSPATMDTGVDSPPEMFPAYFDLPQIVSLGGSTMATPKVVPIVFANEDANKKSTIPTFLALLPNSTYWSATTKEYGVQSLAIAQTVMLVENAPSTITGNGIESWLAAAIGTKLPANDANTIYLLYYPQSTTINALNGTSCVNWGGYHSEMFVQQKSVVYGVVAGCASYSARLAPGDSVGGLDFTTGLSTHEIIEAVTDPHVQSKPAYAQMDSQHRAWTLYLNGAEVGDACEMEPSAFYKDANLGYTVQRTWSNQSAAAGHDPCVPPIGTPYVAAYPKFNGMFGPTVALNGTTTIAVSLASDGPTNGPWNVKAIDYSAERGGQQKLQLSLAPSSGKNGDTLMLTVKVLATDVNGAEGYILESDYGGARRRIAGLVHQ